MKPKAHRLVFAENSERFSVATSRSTRLRLLFLIHAGSRDCTPLYGLYTMESLLWIGSIEYNPLYVHTLNFKWRPRIATSKLESQLIILLDNYES